jgi:hypothetical protein
VEYNPFRPICGYERLTSDHFGIEVVFLSKNNNQERDISEKKGKHHSSRKDKQRKNNKRNQDRRT